MNMNIQLERKIPNVQCWLANHSTNLKHNFDFSNPKILDKEHKNSINKRSDISIVFLMFIKNF